DSFTAGHKSLTRRGSCPPGGLGVPSSLGFFRSAWIISAVVRAISSSLPLVCPALKKSETSPFGGRPGNLTILTLRPTARQDPATPSAWFSPAWSLSGKITIHSAPDARSCSLYSARHLPAPPGFVVAVSPC